MNGIGTNEDIITEVLTKRSNHQRQSIRTAFKHEFGSDLVADLRDELSGHYREVILVLMETPMNYLAAEIHNATAKHGTDEDVLSEVKKHDQILEVQFIEVFCCLLSPDFVLVEQQ